MKIILTNSEITALETLRTNISAATRIFDKLANSKKVNSEVRRIKSKMFRPESDKWGDCKTTATGVELNVNEKAACQFINIMQTTTLKYISILENIVNSIMSFSSVCDELTEEFDKEWYTNRYVRVKELTSAVITTQSTDMLFREYDIVPKQVWALETLSGSFLMIIRDDKYIYVFRSFSSDPDCIRHFPFTISDGERKAQEQLEEKRVRDEIESGTFHEDRQFEDYYVMSDKDLIQILKDHRVVRK